MTVYEIDTLLNKGLREYPDHEYIFERKADGFCGIPFSVYAGDVRRTAAALLEKGLAGKHIILFAGNSYSYIIADTAIMGYVGTSCTLSKEWKADDLARAAKMLDAAAIIYDTERAETVSVLHTDFPQMQLLRMEDLLNQPAQTADLIPADPSVCCKIIFSSGTTGKPKAVMLSQKMMFANWESLYLRTPFTKDDRDYLFLPLSHTYSGICNYLYSLCTGMQIYLCSDTKKITEELQLVRPTVFCAVPLIFERIYAVCSANGLSPAAALGGNIKYLFCGGAYFKPELRKYFKDAGLNLLEAYGLTETSSIISVEYPNTDDFASVGTVMENQDIRIDEPDENGIGEIMVRGDNLFAGYFANPEATAAAFDTDGFFRTGDLGYLDGRKLYLKGRKRRMILLSNGENVYPDELEAAYARFPQVTKAKVFAENAQICAVLYVSIECDGEALTEQVNASLPRYAQIRRTEIIRDGIDARLK